MKTLVKTGLIALALPVGLLCASHAAAATIEVNDWYAISSDNNSSIANGNTSSPTYTNGTPSTYLFAYFADAAAPLVLADGEKVTLSFDVSLNLGHGAERKPTALRIGLFHASAPRASVATYGADRTTTMARAGKTISDWTGFMLDKGSRQSPLRILQKTGGSALSTNTNNGTDNYAANSSAFNTIFVNAAARSFTWELTRSGNDLAYTLKSGTQTVSSTLAGAFAAGSNSFDGFLLYIGNIDDTVVNTASLNNVSITRAP